MSKLAINLVARSYDLLMPLACGDVQVESVDLNLDRRTDMREFCSTVFQDFEEMMRGDMHA